MSLEDYDKDERQLLVELHEQNPTLSTEELLDAVKELTRVKYYGLLKGVNVFPSTSHETHS
jgi:hypothetical protein